VPNSSDQYSGIRSGRANGEVDASIVQRRNEANTGSAAAERSPLFLGTPPEDYESIADAARVKEFTRGQALHVEGDSVQQIMVLTMGIAKVTQLGALGAEVILRFGVPGDVLGAVGLFSNGRHRTAAQAMRSCRALVWDAPAFKTLVERFPVLHQNMARILGNDLLELEERFREVATEKVGPRVARQLVRLLEKIGREVDGEVEIGLSREQLAQMTGTTLFTVSRLLSAWDARGAVRPRREGVTIRDIKLLRSISESR
jgi:CRP-like cAMP-binding protein